MAAAALLREHPQPTDEQIDAAMTNICRCGTYHRVRAAIHRAASENERAREFLVATSVIGGGMALAILPGAAARRASHCRVGADAVVDDLAGQHRDGARAWPGIGHGQHPRRRLSTWPKNCSATGTKVRVEPISFNRNVREGNLYLGATGIWSTFAGAGASGDVDERP